MIHGSILIKKNVHFSARVGYEQIYRALYENLGMRVHVEKGQYDFFACLPNIQEWLTTDPTMTCFHACRTVSSNFSQACASFRYCEKPIRILLSIMWFTEQVSASEKTFIDVPSFIFREFQVNYSSNIMNIIRISIKDFLRNLLDLMNLINIHRRVIIF